MGNAQSSGHHSHRLSKPRTNTNAPSFPSKADLSADISSRYVDLSASGRQKIRAELLSPTEPEFAENDSGAGDDNMGELALDVQRRLSNLSRSNSLSCFGGKSDSTTKLSSLPGSKASLVTSCQVDVDTAIKLLQEVKRNASPEDLAALQQALQPTESPTEQGLSRRTSVVNGSSSSLTRRRSLVPAPGVATRSSPMEDKAEGRRRKWSSWQTPQLNPEEEEKWKVNMMGSSPLTRIAAMESQGGRNSPTRAQTPSDMDYSHLGSLKLGSLVVTNGAASPAPSTIGISQSPRSKITHEEDYFGSTEVSAALMMKPAKRRGYGRSKSSVEPPTPPLHRSSLVPEDARRLKTTSKSQNPSKMSARAQQQRQETPEVPIPAPEGIRNERSADLFAKNYQAEIPESPFAPAFPTEVHDEGFASDDPNPSRAEALRSLDGTTQDESTAPCGLSASKSPSAPVVDHIAQKPKRPSRRPTPMQADSGYSSGGSFQAAQQDSKLAHYTKPIPATSTLKSVSGNDSDDTGSVNAFEQTTNRPDSHELLAPLCPGTSSTSRPNSLQLPPRPSAESMTSSVMMSPSSFASQSSTESRTSGRHKRLQKRKQSHPELPVVQSCQSIPEGNIPHVPSNVKTQFSRRLSETPGMEYLTRTYISKDHVNNDEPLDDDQGTVFNEFAKSIPSKPQFEERPDEERPPTPPPHRIRRSLSIFRGKSKTRKPKSGLNDIEKEQHIVDLGTIATSLGNSPYDAAMDKATNQSVASPTHPYQLGNSLPRAKSMVNMDNEVAAEYARMRSRDRGQCRPQMPQRPQSYHETKLETFDGAASNARPRSIYANTTPIPSIVEPNKNAAQCGDPVQDQSNLNIRSRKTGPGPVVSNLADKYDRCVQQQPTQDGANWDHHAQLWSQRRKSIGEGLCQNHTDKKDSLLSRTPRAKSRSREHWSIDRYGGGLDYGYERGYGIGGSAGTRQLHSYASRKSLHFSNQYGVDLSDVPVFLQRA